MKSQVRLIALILAIFSGIASLHAGDKAPAITYQAEVAGVMCSACSKKVQVALEKLDGVTNVKVKAGQEPSVALVEITSTSPNLTKEAAIAALGADASSYLVRSLKKKE